MTNDTLSIYKGDLVQLTISEKNRGSPRIMAWRRKNEKEMEQEREWIRQDPLDSAGEPRLASHWICDVFPQGHTMIVVKARCALWIAYHKQTKMAQLLDTNNGNTYYVKRENIKNLRA